MGGIDKMFTLLGGEPLLARAIDVFQNCDSVHQVVVALAQPNLERGQKLVAERSWSKVTVCPGGERRQDSVLNGLNQLTGCQWVVIHDGARPMVTIDLIERGLAAAKETGSAIAAVPVVDTIKMAGDDMVVQGTPPRRSLWAVQTPQVFRFDIISQAYRQARYEVTDDAMLVERSGNKVKIYMGAYDNIKVTTPDDLAIAEALLKKRGKL